MDAQLLKQDDQEFRDRWIKLNEGHHRMVKLLARWTERWIKAAATNEHPIATRWVLFAGPTGAGKTHCLKNSYAFMRAHAGALWPKYYRQPPALKWVNWSKAMQLEKHGWDEFEAEVREARMVFVDDLGSETDRYRTGEPAERLRVFLDLCEAKWLMATTNICRQDFEKTFDIRTQSRIERARCLDLTGVPDYRPKLQDKP